MREVPGARVARAKNSSKNLERFKTRDALSIGPLVISITISISGNGDFLTSLCSSGLRDDRDFPIYGQADCDADQIMSDDYILHN